jgi:outer membrane protein assembly factor BamE (lipoprotein component of BamABCDE complex)
MPVAAPVPLLETGEAASASQRSAQPAKATSQHSSSSQPTTRKIYSYITVGSTKAEVLDQVGAPTASTNDKLVYGQSELYFKNDAVTGWKIDAANPIRVKLWPESAVDPALTSFTVGSTRDEVLIVQGTPTAFSDNKFEYGTSEVYFQNHRVVRWKSDPASVQLRAQ